MSIVRHSAEKKLRASLRFGQLIAVIAHRIKDTGSFASELRAVSKIQATLQKKQMS
jgi:hypothetical protein